jgi:hypothetical protein
MSKMRLTIVSRTLAAVLAVTSFAAAGAGTASAHPIHPIGHHGWGPHGWGGYAAGGVALGILGAMAYEGYQQDCVIERRFDIDGNYLGRVKVCRPVEY